MRMSRQTRTIKTKTLMKRLKWRTRRVGLKFLLGGKVILLEEGVILPSEILGLLKKLLGVLEEEDISST